VSNATLVVANVLTCNLYSPIIGAKELPKAKLADWYRPCWMNMNAANHLNMIVQSSCTAYHHPHLVALIVQLCTNGAATTVCLAQLCTRGSCFKLVHHPLEELPPAPPVCCISGVPLRGPLTVLCCAMGVTATQACVATTAPLSHNVRLYINASN